MTPLVRRSILGNVDNSGHNETHIRPKLDGHIQWSTNEHECDKISLQNIVIRGGCGADSSNETDNASTSRAIAKQSNEIPGHSRTNMLEGGVPPVDRNVKLSQRTILPRHERKSSHMVGTKDEDDSIRPVSGVDVRCAGGGTGRAK